MTGRSYTLLIFLLGLMLFTNACKQSRMVVHNLPKINTYKIFDAHVVNPSPVPFHFKETPNLTALGDKIVVNSHPLHPEAVTLTNYLKHSKTRAFILIRNDSIIYENYFKGFEQQSTVTSFSIAKSFLNAMLGVAIDSGLIKSVQQPICDFFPELDKNKLGKVTIEHLLRHTSGIRFKSAGHQYYTYNITRQYNKYLRCRWEPGTKFYYDNANSQTLGILLQRVYKKDLAQVLEETIWKPCGMEYPISWSVDSRYNGMVKAFCCLNGVARDFAKLGRLYLNQGNWNGKQIVSTQWVKQSTTPDASLGGLRTEKYHWWTLPDSDGAFYAGGLYGQYILVYPKKNIILIRFAERNLQPVAELQDFFRQVLEQL